MGEQQKGDHADQPQRHQDFGMGEDRHALLLRGQTDGHDQSDGDSQNAADHTDEDASD